MLRSGLELDDVPITHACRDSWRDNGFCPCLVNFLFDRASDELLQYLFKPQIERHQENLKLTPQQRRAEETRQFEARNRTRRSSLSVPVVSAQRRSSTAAAEVDDVVLELVPRGTLPPALSNPLLSLTSRCARGQTLVHFGVLAHVKAPRMPAAAFARLVRSCLACGVDLNASTYDGSTALHFACIFYAKAAIEALLAAGADMDRRDCDGCFPDEIIDSDAHYDDLRALFAAERQRQNDEHVKKRRSGLAEVFKDSVMCEVIHIIAEYDGKTFIPRRGGGSKRAGGR
jgi:hypothetical protein